MRSRGYLPTDDEDGASAWIVCSGSSGCAWLEVLDEDGDELARELSQRLGVPSVVLGECDGMFDATLWLRGERVDRHEIVDGGELRPGSPEAWALALGEPGVRAPLRAAFAETDAPTAYDAVMQALQLAPRDVEGTEEDDFSEVLAFEPVAEIEAQRPPALHWGAPGDVEPEDLAPLDVGAAVALFEQMGQLLGPGVTLRSGLGGGHPTLALRLGGARPLSHPMHNRGGLAKALSLELSGTALKDELVRVVGVSVRQSGETVRARGDGARFEATGLSIAGLPDRPLRRADEERATVLIDVELEAKAAGSGTLELRAQANGATTTSPPYRVEIRVS